MSENGLTRQIGAGAAASLVVSNMVGAGIFTTSGFLIVKLGSPLLMLAVWLLGGFLALTGAIAYGELGASLPREGGDYVYLRQAYGPLWAFLSGWMSFFAGFGAPIALTALGATAYLGPFIPALAQGQALLFTVPFLKLPVLAGQLAALALVWILSLFHYTGIRMSGRFQSVLTTLNVALIVSFIVGAVLLGSGSWVNLAPAGTGFDIGKLPAVAVSLIIVMYAYTGFNAAGYVAGEIRDPARNLPRALVAGSVLVILLYLALNVVYLYALPAGQMSGRIDIADVAATALFGPGPARVVSLFIALCVLASCSAMVCIAPRIYYAMARDGAFLNFTGKLSPRFGSPGRALLVQAAWVSLLILAGSFEQLLTYCGFMLSLFAALTISTIFILRWKQPTLARPWRAWGYPWTPAFYLAVSVWMMVYVLFSSPRESLIGILIVALGAPVYLLRRWKGGSGDSGKETV